MTSSTAKLPFSNTQKSDGGNAFDITAWQRKIVWVACLAMSLAVLIALLRAFTGLAPVHPHARSLAIIIHVATVLPAIPLGGYLLLARGAYELVLEAFWTGDRDTLRDLCDDDVFAGFSAAIDAREEAGHTLDNKLVRIEETRIHSASLDGRIARIAILFVADIAAVTRDAQGAVVAGSLDDAIESRDIWTFSRNTASRDPNWVLDETDEG